MTTDPILTQDAENPETAEPNEDADVALFGNNPEYQLDVYQKVLDYRKIKQSILDKFSGVGIFLIVQAVTMVVERYNSSLFGLILIYASGFSGIIYIVAGWGYKLNKPWKDSLYIIGIIPCIISLNVFSIALVVWIPLSLLRRFQLIVRDIRDNYSDIDPEEMSEYIIGPYHNIESKYLIDIPVNSRLFHLERFLLRQILDPYHIPRRWEIFQTTIFRQAAHTVSRLPETKGSFIILTFIIIMILAIGNMTGIVLWVRIFLYLFIPVQFIIFYLISFSRQITTILSLFRYGIYLLLIHLQFVLMISFHTNHILPAIINLVLIPPVIILLILYYFRLTRAFEIIRKSNIKWIDLFIKKYSLLHCMLRTYQKRFILSEESGWDEDDKTAVQIDSSVTASTDWQFNTDQKEKKNDE